MKKSQIIVQRQSKKEEEKKDERPGRIIFRGREKSEQSENKTKSKNTTRKVRRGKNAL